MWKSKCHQLLRIVKKPMNTYKQLLVHLLFSYGIPLIITF